MTTVTIQKTERQYYIDWLRILLIISVFLFHIGMIFNIRGWHIMFEGIAGFTYRPEAFITLPLAGKIS
jgi:peptidoglycan/LPS O-acetylase OafA/YrhL